MSAGERFGIRMRPGDSTAAGSTTWTFIATTWRVSRQGFSGAIDVAPLDVAAVPPAARVVPSTSVRIDATWRELVATVILKIDADRPVALQTHARHRCLRR
jgi:acyl-CoA hydrolase